MKWIILGLFPALVLYLLTAVCSSRLKTRLLITPNDQKVFRLEAATGSILLEKHEYNDIANTTIRRPIDLEFQLFLPNDPFWYVTLKNIPPLTKEEIPSVLLGNYYVGKNSLSLPFWLVFTVLWSPAALLILRSRHKKAKPQT